MADEGPVAAFDGDQEWVVVVAAASAGVGDQSGPAQNVGDLGGSDHGRPVFERGDQPGIAGFRWRRLDGAVLVVGVAADETCCEQSDSQLVYGDGFVSAGAGSADAGVQLVQRQGACGCDEPFGDAGPSPPDRLDE